MNPYPQERSVLVIDNCRIHHNEALQDLVNGAGPCCVVSIPLLLTVHAQDVFFCTYPPIHPTSTQLKSRSVPVSVSISAS